MDFQHTFAQLTIPSDFVQLQASVSLRHVRFRLVDDDGAAVLDLAFNGSVLLQQRLESWKFTTHVRTIQMTDPAPTTHANFRHILSPSVRAASRRRLSASTSTASTGAAAATGTHTIVDQPAALETETSDLVVRFSF
jgi:hypothetical protein